METAETVQAQPRRVLLMLEWTPTGVRVSHCKASEALADLAQAEMLDRTPANLLEIGVNQLREWVYEYSHGKWARGVYR
jgi:hypothetical protein